MNFPRIAEKGFIISYSNPSPNIYDNDGIISFPPDFTFYEDNSHYGTSFTPRHTNICYVRAYVFSDFVLHYGQVAVIIYGNKNPDVQVLR